MHISVFIHLFITSNLYTEIEPCYFTQQIFLMMVEKIMINHDIIKLFNSDAEYTNNMKSGAGKRDDPLTNNMT